MILECCHAVEVKRFFLKDAAGAAQKLVSLWESGSMVHGLQEGFVVGPNASEEDERAGGPGHGLVREAIASAFMKFRCS